MPAVGWRAGSVRRPPSTPVRVSPSGPAHRRSRRRRRRARRSGPMKRPVGEASDRQVRLSAHAGPRWLTFFFTRSTLETASRISTEEIASKSRRLLRRLRAPAAAIMLAAILPALSYQPPNKPPSPSSWATTWRASPHLCNSATFLTAVRSTGLGERRLAQQPHAHAEHGRARRRWRRAQPPLRLLLLLAVALVLLTGRMPIHVTENNGTRARRRVQARG